MIFKQYLNIAAAIAAGTTYCTATAMNHLAMTSYERQEYHSMIKDENEYFGESEFTAMALAFNSKGPYSKSGFRAQMTYPNLERYFPNPAPTETLNAVERDTAQNIVQSLRQSKHPRQNTDLLGITKKSQKATQTYTFDIRGKEVEIKRDNRNPSLKQHLRGIKNKMPDPTIRNYDFNISTWQRNDRDGWTTWINTLDTGPQIPKAIQNTIVSNCAKNLRTKFAIWKPS